MNIEIRPQSGDRRVVSREIGVNGWTTDGQTDRRTDGRTSGHHNASVASPPHITGGGINIFPNHCPDPHTVTEP